MSKLILGQRLKLRVAHASRELHPSEDLSELPLSGQEYQRWCCHRKTDRPRSAFWKLGYRKSLPSMKRKRGQFSMRFLPGLLDS